MKINQVTFGEIGRLNPAQLIRLLHLRVATGVAANRNSETRRRSAAPAQRRREHDLPVESDSGGYPPIISDFYLSPRRGCQKVGVTASRTSTMNQSARQRLPEGLLRR